MAKNKTMPTLRLDMPESIARVKHIVAIGSGKGGVGKSTVTTNLAIALAKTGAKVGLMDADIYGPSQPGMLGAGFAQPEMRGENIIPLRKYGLTFMSIGLFLTEDQPVIWRGPMAAKMIQQFLTNVSWGELDYLLVDLPPGSGDVQLTLAQQAYLAGAIIVTTPQQVALGVANKGLQMFRYVKVPILGIIENMSGFTCPHCGKNTAIFKEGGGAELARQMGVEFLGGIPIDPDLMASGDDGIPLLERTVETPAAKAFVDLAARFRELTTSGKGADDQPRSIELTDGRLVIEWPDGYVGRFSPYDLRLQCPCAQCVDEDTGKKRLDPKRVPLDIRITGVEKVGRYAVTVAFSDGHNTGIYKYDRLKEMEDAQKGISGQSFSV